jgi:hypothetical protein
MPAHRKGEKVCSELKAAVPKTLELSRTAVTVGSEQLGVLLKKKSSRVRSRIEQRDSAIRAGAAGATTYVIKDSKFQVQGRRRTGTW